MQVSESSRSREREREIERERARREREAREAAERARRAAEQRPVTPVEPQRPYGDVAVRPPVVGLAGMSEFEPWASDLDHVVVRDPAASSWDGALDADDIADVDGNGVHDLADVEAALADPGWRAQVDAAYNALDAADQAAYDAIAVEIAHDPRAALAFEEMLVDGRLLQGNNAEGANTLTALSEGTGTGADNTWLADLVQELDDPQTITQGGMSNCGATSLATYMAMHDPAEYARLVVGLVVDGSVVTRNGNTLVRDDRTQEKWDSLQANHRSSFGAAVLIEAIMEVSYPHGEYDPIRDGHEMLFGLFTTPGTLPDEYAYAFTALTGQSSQWHLFGLVHRDDEMKVLSAAVAAGETVPASITYGGSLHWVLVTGIDADGTVHYVNPWGREETASGEDFQRNLTSFVLPQ